MDGEELDGSNAEDDESEEEDRKTSKKLKITIPQKRRSKKIF